MFCQRGHEFYSRSFILYLSVCQVPVGKLRATMVAVGTYNRTVRLFSRMCRFAFVHLSLFHLVSHTFADFGSVVIVEKGSEVKVLVSPKRRGCLFC